MKKTLLIAAAALVAGIVTSEAQVYSANIVGYVNVACTAGQYVGAATPLDLDGIDNVTNVLSAAPKGTSVLTWNGSGFTTITRSAITGNWPAGAATTFLPPGTGYLIKAGATYTNTYVGNVVPNPGGNSSTVALTAGVYQFVGSTPALGGFLTDSGTNTLNLGPVLAKGSSVLVWNGGTWQTATKSAITGNWNTNLPISVAEGMLIKPAAATNWVQTLQ